LICSHHFDYSAFCGGRVGFVHGPPAIMAAVKGIQTYYSFAAAHPLQLAAARALRDGISACLPLSICACRRDR
jgi:aspartate/methionine/tyrosine aminotransferase